MVILRFGLYMALVESIPSSGDDNILDTSVAVCREIHIESTRLQRKWKKAA